MVARDKEPLEAAVLDFDEVAAATEAIQVMAQLTRRRDMGGAAETTEVDAGALPDDGTQQKRDGRDLATMLSAHAACLRRIQAAATASTPTAGRAASAGSLFPLESRLLSPAPVIGVSLLTPRMVKEKRLASFP